MSLGKHFVVCGDININYLKETNEKQNFECIINTYGFRSLVNFPTRVTKNSVSSLDQFITNLDQKTLECIGEPIYFSDHDAQILEIKNALNSTSENQTGQMKSKSRPNFTSKIFSEFKQKLETENWASVYQAVDVEEKYKNFLNIFKLNYNECFKPKLIRI